MLHISEGDFSLRLGMKLKAVHHLRFECVVRGGRTWWNDHWPLQASAYFVQISDCSSIWICFFYFNSFCCSFWSHVDVKFHLHFKILHTWTWTTCATQRNNWMLMCELPRRCKFVGSSTFNIYIALGNIDKKKMKVYPNVKILLDISKVDKQNQVALKINRAILL